ncbi:MAG: hypothetical protein M0R40_05255 [Firmicutes bacterium]|nr:hypothetical protein [Bacillota bacterium]
MLNKNEVKRGISGMLEFPCDVERLANKNTLITDAGDETSQGSEIIEVDLLGKVVWRYGDNLIFAHSAERLENGNTLISDTTNNRVIEVNPNGEMVFTSDGWSDGTGLLSDGTHLHYPNDCKMLTDGSMLITDRNNDRCLVCSKKGVVLWSYDFEIKHPHNCSITPQGTFLIADSDGNRIIEVNKEKEIVWQCDKAGGKQLNWPRSAVRLDDGNTLICDSRNSRVVEVNVENELVWAFEVSYFANFYKAVKLPCGNVLISDQQHHQVLEVDRFKNIVWQFRNYRNTNTIHQRLKNGSFKQRGNTSDAPPEDWILFNRFSEGGGKVIWDENESPRPCPGLEYDRNGVVYLQQIVAVEPGRTYKMAGKLKTQLYDKNSFAYLQMAFLDNLGGLIEDASVAPKGNMFVGENDWQEDVFEATAPQNAFAAELRIVLCGRGRIFAKSIMLLQL